MIKMAFELFGLAGMSLWATLIGLALLARYMGWLTAIPVAKKTAGIGAVALIAYGLVSGGIVALPQQVEEVEEEAAPMQYLDVTYEDGATHVTDGDSDYIKVEYGENTVDGGIYFADDADTSDMENVIFDIALHRIDTLTDNDIVFSISANQIQVENDDDDDSPFDVFDEADDAVEVELEPSGGTGTDEYNTVVIGAADDETVTVTADILDEALANIETYDSARDTTWITIKGPDGKIQHTLEIEFLKTGEV